MMPMATLDGLRVEVRFLGRMLADIGSLICQLKEGLRSLLAILAVLLHVRDQSRADTWLVNQPPDLAMLKSA